MAFQVLMPKIGFAMNEGTLTEWLFEDGTTVTEGTALYLLESEKSVQEIVAPASGTLKIVAEPGNVYEVGVLLAEIG